MGGHPCIHVGVGYTCAKGWGALAHMRKGAECAHVHVWRVGQACRGVGACSHACVEVWSTLMDGQDELMRMHTTVEHACAKEWAWAGHLCI